MTTVALIGAGSTVFTRKLVTDLSSFAELRDTIEFRFHDINPERLDASVVVSQRILDALGSSSAIIATSDLGQALEGA